MALALGIIALILGTMGAIVAGWLGVGIVAVLGGLAIFFQIKKNKSLGEAEKRKRGGMICGIIGIVIVFLGQVGMIGLADKVKDAAVKDGNAEYIVAGADGLKSMGVIGLLTKAMDAKPEGVSDQQFYDDLKEQTDRISKVVNGTR